MEIQVSTNAGEVSLFVDRLVREQVPFAAARALTDLALSSRSVMLGHITSTYQIRRQSLLTERTGVMRIRPGRKADWPNVSSEVGVAEWAEFMVKQERGGEHRAESGRRIAVPARWVADRRRQGRVPKQWRPRPVRERPGAQVSERGNVSAPVRGVRGPEPMFWLRRRIRIEPTLQLQERVQRHVAGRWPAAFRARLREAVLSARPPTGAVRLASRVSARAIG